MNLSLDVARIFVLLLWMFLATWSYILIVYLLSVFWLLRKPKGKIVYSLPLVLWVIILLVVQGILQIGNIILYSIPKGGNSLFNSDITINTMSGTTNLLYLIVFVLALFFILCQIVTFVVLTNNILAKLTQDRLFLLGLTIYYSSIFELSFSKSKRWWKIEYVYKQEKKTIWRENVYFIPNFLVTKFLQTELPKVVDFKKNQTNFSYISGEQTKSELSKKVTQKKSSSTK